MSLSIRTSLLTLVVVASGLAASPGFAETISPGSIGRTPLVHTLPTAVDQVFVTKAALAALGNRIFNDANLSEPSGTSCASCHDPSRGLSSSRVKRFGVAEGSRPKRFGTRNVPALRYARYTPPLVFFSDESDDDPTPQPHGGLFHDGRVDQLEVLPQVPLLNRLEMNNRTAAAVARKLRDADYASELRTVAGPRSLGDANEAIAALAKSLKAYLQSDELSPFSSRYDAFIAGKGGLSALEQKGMQLFRDPLKGNCGSCHAFNPDSSNPLRSMFTDYGFEAIGVPRNDLRPGRRAAQPDLGLCTVAAAKGWPNPGQWCGYFRTPSLRNVALRERFMHNGVFGDLRTVVEFYSTRSTDPSRWYPRGVLFDDLPARYRRNVNVIVSPWNRRPGAKPGLDATEIDAVVAFLGTLTDRDLMPSRQNAASIPPRP